jgi:hypothetical protein
MRNISLPALLAWLAALAALLTAWFVPLPRLVLSEEEHAAGRMPANRAAVQQAELAFQTAEEAYRGYISTNDVGAAIDTLQATVDAAQPDPARSALRMAVLQSADPVLAYLDHLQAYALAGEQYFTALRHYDDELMAWTRSLGSASEQLRPDTWPIVEYLKLYPPPTGQQAEYASLTASDVTTYSKALRDHAVFLNAAPSADNPSLTALAQDVKNVREAGRSIEYLESLHPDYHDTLVRYDSRVQAIAAQGTAGMSSGRVVLSTAFTALLGLITLGGIAFVLLPRRDTPTEAPS